MEGRRRTKIGGTFAPGSLAEDFPGKGAKSIQDYASMLRMRPMDGTQREHAFRKHRLMCEMPQKIETAPNVYLLFILYIVISHK